MIPIPHDFLEFLRLLDQYNVKHLLIGGYAVAYHGYVRTTGDLDVFVEASEENARKLMQACIEFGLGSSVTESLLMEEGNVLRCGLPPMRLEILNRISGVSFEECWESRDFLPMKGVNIPVINVEKLLKNKKASGRTKDLLDFEMLEDRRK